MIVRRIAITVLSFAVCGSALAAPPPGFSDGGPGWWRINPRSTFYRTSGDAKAERSFFFILAELPFANPSVPLTVQIFGDYRPNSGTGDVGRALHGVFTKTPTILVSDVQRRLPDAVPAACRVTTGPTYKNSLPTEIPEDFRITPDSTGKFKIAIPAGAEWIAVCIPDSYYSDNDDPDDDLYIRFSR